MNTYFVLLPHLSLQFLASLDTMYLIIIWRCATHTSFTEKPSACPAPQPAPPPLCPSTPPPLTWSWQRPPVADPRGEVGRGGQSSWWISPRVSLATGGLVVAAPLQTPGEDVALKKQWLNVGLFMHTFHSPKECRVAVRLKSCILRSREFPWD